MLTKQPIENTVEFVYRLRVKSYKCDRVDKIVLVPKYGLKRISSLIIVMQGFPPVQKAVLFWGQFW